MLYLDLGGLQLQLGINRFREDLPGESEHDNWCLMDFTVRRNGVNIYHNYQNSPWLTCDEVQEIRDTIAGVLDGSVTQDKSLYFIEPDIQFEFTFNDGKFSYADMILGYWETEGCGTFTGNRLILALDTYDMERMLCYLQFKTHVNYDKTLFESCCVEGEIVPDKLSFKIIEGQIAPGETPKSGVVGIFINDRELLDIVADLESKKWKSGAFDYIHQTAKELHNHLATEKFTDGNEEYGIAILSCTCGIIEDGSPTVFIEKDENYVYWKALGHNQIDKENYYFPLDYIFERKQYEEALNELKRFSDDEDIY